MRGQSFLEMLLVDVNNAILRHEATGSQSDKRDLLRTTFAAIEGIAWVFREYIVETAESTFGLEPDEVGAFSETSYLVSKNGKVRTQQKFIPLLNSIKLTARVAHRIAPSRTIEFSVAEWERLQRATDIRNRITHPKNTCDLILSDADIKLGTDALYWLLTEVTDVMDAANQAAISYLGEFEAVFKRLQSGDPEMLALYERTQRGASVEESH